MGVVLCVITGLLLCTRRPWVTAPHSVRYCMPCSWGGWLPPILPAVPWGTELSAVAVNGLIDGKHQAPTRLCLKDRTSRDVHMPMCTLGDITKVCRRHSGRRPRPRLGLPVCHGGSLASPAVLCNLFSAEARLCRTQEAKGPICRSTAP